MRVFRDISTIHVSDIPESVVALGTFDGMHLGHREILMRCVSRGRQDCIPSVAFTFQKHPVEVIRPQFAPLLLTDIEDKLALIQGIGIDNTVIAQFDEEMARATPEEFVREILVDSLRARHVIIGFNYTFGWKAQGNAESLRELGEKHGFRVEVAEPVLVDGAVVSSTRIRSHLGEGDMEGAQAMLGRPFSIKGRIIRGESRGKTLGYPTVNLDVSHGTALPKCGVYATGIHVKGHMFKAVTNIGTRPTFAGKNVSVETHIIGFEGDLYGETIRVFFVKRLRDEIRFPTSEALACQISQDVKRAKELLNHWTRGNVAQGVSEDAS